MHGRLQAMHVRDMAEITWRLYEEELFGSVFPGKRRLIRGLNNSTLFQVSRRRLSDSAGAPEEARPGFGYNRRPRPPSVHRPLLWRRKGEIPDSEAGYRLPGRSYLSWQNGHGFFR